MFSSYTQLDCKGYALSVTFYRIEIELFVLKLCPDLLGQSFSKLSYGSSSDQKSKSHQNHCKININVLL